VKYNLQQAKNIVLSATYETLVYHSQFESFGTDDVHKRLDRHFAAGFVQRMLTSLSQDDLVIVGQYDETSRSHYTLSDKGFEYVEKLPALSSLLEPEEKETKPEKKVIPASNRSVPLDHNRPEYKEIAAGFDEAIETAKKTKPNDVSGDEHASLISGLEGARALWNAFDLSIIQVKVGIVMAVEKAESALKKSFSMVKGPLLMEAIKEFFKAVKSGGVF